MFPADFSYYESFSAKIGDLTTPETICFGNKTNHTLLKVVFLLPLRAVKPISHEIIELHRKILKNKWKLLKTEGSHYIYEKEERMYPVPYHGSKEVGMGILHKIVKEMKLK